LHPERFSIDWKAFYDEADALTAETRKALPHRLDIPYGEDPKQKLDLYLPLEKPAGPVFLFIHGGGFVEGDRAHYGYVARPLAERGIITVVMSYRLQPAHYPDQAEDTRRALAWVHRNIASHGGDPGRIYLGGHSAGAILSAFVAVKRDWLEALGLPADSIRGFLPISGPYDLVGFGSFVDVYLPDPSRREEASPARNIMGNPPPAIVAYGSLEEPFAAQSRAFVEALKARGGEARLLVLEGMNHADTALAAGSERSPLVAALLGLIESRPDE
jgi:arylformamidase